MKRNCYDWLPLNDCLPMYLMPLTFFDKSKLRLIALIINLWVILLC